jgi:hypothetical protein
MLTKGIKVYQKLSPIRFRRRVSRKECAFDGDYLEDVDEGVLEEVRIFNEDLNISTLASCEGHLPVKELSAYILCDINDEQRKLFRKHMEEIGKTVEAEDKHRKYVFEERDYRVTFQLFGKYVRGCDDKFRIKIRSKKDKMIQNDWDNLRKSGFKKAIKICTIAFG